MDHDLRAERRLKETTPRDGWRQYTTGHEARVTCTCGLDSGWLERTAARAIATEHARDNGIPIDIPGEDGP